MECTTCGRHNRIGDVYCRTCGQVLEPHEQKGASVSSPSNRTHKMMKKPFGIGCLLGPIVGGGISSIVGVIVGYISSFVYSMVGDTQNTALAYLLSGGIFMLSFSMSYGLSTVAKKIGLKPK